MRIIPLILAGLYLVVASVAFSDTSKQSTDIKQHQSCRHCGMDREKFSQSRMLIKYEDGSTVATCSLHCSAVELANTIDKIPIEVSVADFNSKELIDAEKAIWVLGGSIKGVMTAHAKWAFTNLAAAERFKQTNGGTVVSFDEAIKAAYDDMYQDTKIIREFRKMKKMKHHGSISATVPDSPAKGG
jgi:nitrous oxide reductase accessory protein NosL